MRGGDRGRRLACDEGGQRLFDLGGGRGAVFGTLGQQPAHEVGQRAGRIGPECAQVGRGLVGVGEDLVQHVRVVGERGAAGEQIEQRPPQRVQVGLVADLGRPPNLFGFPQGGS